jgi:hypothetical protein
MTLRERRAGEEKKSGRGNSLYSEKGRTARV